MLAERGVSVQWSTTYLGFTVGGSSMRFGAELAHPELPNFNLIPKTLLKRLLGGGLALDDPDLQKLVRLDGPAGLQERFAGDPVVSPLLFLMGGLRLNDLGMNVVRCQGGKLQFRLSKAERLDDLVHHELQVAVAQFVAALLDSA